MTCPCKNIQWAQRKKATVLCDYLSITLYVNSVNMFRTRPPVDWALFMLFLSHSHLWLIRLCHTTNHTSAERSMTHQDMNNLSACDHFFPCSKIRKQNHPWTVYHEMYFKKCSTVGHLVPNRPFQRESLIQIHIKVSSWSHYSHIWNVIASQYAAALRILRTVWRQTLRLSRFKLNAHVTELMWSNVFSR